jgi:hypothetical protein
MSFACMCGEEQESNDRKQANKHAVFKVRRFLFHRFLYLDSPINQVFNDFLSCPLMSLVDQFSLHIYIYFCGRNMHSSTSLFCEMKTQSPEERVRKKKNNKGISSGILLSFRFHFRSKFRRKWIQVQLKNK